MEKLNGKQVVKKISEILSPSECIFIETDNCSGCEKRIKEVRKILNSLKG